MNLNYKWKQKSNYTKNLTNLGGIGGFVNKKRNRHPNSTRRDASIGVTGAHPHLAPTELAS